MPMTKEPHELPVLPDFASSTSGLTALHFPGYQVKQTPADGNCLFSALADQLGFPMSDSNIIRQELVEFIRDHHNEMVILIFTFHFYFIYFNF
jgi:hypothetical protein